MTKMGIFLINLSIFEYSVTFFINHVIERELIIANISQSIFANYHQDYKHQQYRSLLL